MYNEVEYMPTDKQYNGQLIDEYFRLQKLFDIAVSEKAMETAKAIIHDMSIIKLKIQPTELPELPTIPNMK